MNILHITNHLNTGGITSYVFTLAQGLKRDKINVFIASSAGDQLFKFKKEGITFFPIPIRTKQELSPKMLICFFRLKKFIKENNIELIHTHSRTTQVLGTLLHKFTGVRHITTCHGFFRGRLHRRLFPSWGEKTIAISEQVEEHLINDFKVKKENIVVIHNGIDVEKFAQKRKEDDFEIKKQIGLRDGLVVGIVARLSDVKGHVFLIKALRIVIDKIPEAQLLIVGEGKIYGNLADLAGKLGIEKNVVFLASVDDTRRVLELMDLFVMPSLKEGLGLALMEAMASGICSIGSNVGGIKTLIEHGVRGILVPCADSEALARAIIDLLADPERRGRLGRAGQEFIRQNFSQQKMVENTERVYKECLNIKG